MQLPEWKPDMHESCSRYWAEIFQQEAKKDFKMLAPTVPENSVHKGDQNVSDDGDSVAPTEPELDDGGTQVVPPEPPLAPTAPLESAVPCMHGGAI